ncbi:Homologous-pairing protein 2 like protein [Aduncisulcus paluster]|uniref:Homologous-pairing protein 2 like protein n=1 Tax=Aduncisulcus paluster TaxID=2918883 RepID=A0ABQ5K267_9EUKA|nr:Homologous-pairing protein 2 like protein [Aduncisulcus paluster]|eukprot:gnl/Carplike_NY0171/6946_a9578_153.p1 GENE.gnl/Carplike_NY0171/6946_a9578_153~~gnl/Carplike_NY0171/6946_a9578_153.p1  ORF type:complete len:235 (+),score=55.47 gnl/Carplike_NY0171/6946_a9578_153:2-706(+)
MAPKAKKASSDEVEEATSSLLIERNAPMSLQMVVDGLGSVYGKTAVSKALSALTQQKVLSYVEYGKTAKVWWPNQDNMEIMSLEELADTRLQTQERDKLAGELEVDKTELEAEIYQLKHYPTDSELKQKIESMATENATLSEELVELEKLDIPSDKELSAMDKKYKKYSQLWKAREDAVTDMILQMAEGLDKKALDVSEAAGIEIDEDLPDRKDIDIQYFDKIKKSRKRHSSAK